MSECEPVAAGDLDLRETNVSYSTEIAGHLAHQLSRFLTLNRHQLAGQVANVDFWLVQVQHCLDVIDGYGVRFVRMHAAQEAYVAQHGTTEFALGNGSRMEQRASPPRRIPDRELRTARRELMDATSRFLARCLKDNLITEVQLSRALGSLGIEERKQGK